MFVPTRFLLEGILGFISVTQAGADESPIFGAKIGLIKAAIAPTRDTLLAQLTPADYDGYALGAAVTWSAVFDDLGDLISVRTASTHYQPSGDTTPNTIYGAYLVDGAETNLLGVEIFPLPIGLQSADDGFDYAMTLSLQHSVNWGNGVIG